MDLIIDFSLKAGDKVILCTFRYPEERDGTLFMLESRLNGVYYTGRKAKRQFLLDIGIEPDLWIDDDPHWIFNSL